MFSFFKKKSKYFDHFFEFAPANFESHVASLLGKLTEEIPPNEINRFAWTINETIRLATGGCLRIVYRTIEPGLYGASRDIVAFETNAFLYQAVLSEFARVRKERANAATIDEFRALSIETKFGWDAFIKGNIISVVQACRITQWDRAVCEPVFVRRLDSYAKAFKRGGMKEMADSFRYNLQDIGQSTNPNDHYGNIKIAGATMRDVENTVTLMAVVGQLAVSVPNEMANKLSDLYETYHMDQRG
jgi:hypothetical protein